MATNNGITELISEVKEFLGEIEKTKPETKMEKVFSKITASLYLLLIIIEMRVLRPGVIYVKNEYEELGELKKKLEKTKEEL